MKKILLFVGLTLVTLIGVSVYAANQYNWGTSTGGAWVTPDDTTSTVGQPVQIGSSGGAVVQSGGAPLTLWVRTLAQIQALTPNTTGQIVFCSNCTNTPIVVSTGTGPAAWTSVFLSTGSSSRNPQ